MPYRWLISWALIFRLYVARRILALYSSVRSWDASRGESIFEVPWNPSFSGLMFPSTVPTPHSSGASMIFWDILAIALDYQTKKSFWPMIIKAPGNARAQACSRVERGVQLDPLAIDLFLDVELEFDLEDAFLIDE